jgi:hypothetical protein
VMKKHVNSQSPTPNAQKPLYLGVLGVGGWELEVDVGFFRNLLGDGPVEQAHQRGH